MKITKTEPDNLSQFSLGDRVRVIDPDEKPSEWAIFTISSVKNRRFFLSPLEHQYTYEPFWADPRNITLVTSSISTI